MSVLAKKCKDGRTQTLIDHTLDVVSEVMALSDNAVIDLVSKKCNFEKGRLKDLLFYAAYFHDIGKATQEFRDTLNKKAKSFHSLYSSGIVADIREFEVKEDNKLYLNLLFLLVLTHHQLYWNGIFSGINHEKKYAHSFLPEAKKFFYDHKYYYEQLFKKTCVYDFEYKELSIEDLSTVIDSYLREDLDAISQKNTSISCEDFRLLYSYTLGILNLADWIASAKFEGNNPIITFRQLPTKDEIINKLKISLELDIFILKEFQEQLSNIKGNVLVEIPTGEGKTEGAYLWAINNLKNEQSKIIYTLPTQTTSNKLFFRSKSIFGEETGIIHGSAKIFLEDIYINENGLIDEHFKSELLFSKTFNKPVTVSTIDGVLKYFLNIGRYNIAMLNILNSQIIIDEVHSYDFKLLGFLKRFFELASTYDIPICIMSASIPDKIKELLNISNFSYVTDINLFKKKANYIIKVANKLDNDIETIISEYNKGKNILVVRNKVDKSISVFRKLKQCGIDNIILYNSQFKKKDRVKKEEEIYEKLKNKEHFILVATQVVEISLDIDFDDMFTDVAPIDALIQRFGRVNRKKRTDKIGAIYIYSETDIKPYEKEMLDLTYEIIEDGIHSIEKYNIWLNQIYNQLFDSASTIRHIESLFDAGYKEFDRNIRELHCISESDERYNLRNIEFPKKDFILKEDYDNEDYNFKNTVSMAAWLSDKYLLVEKDISKGIYYDVLNLEYTYEEGVLLPDNEDSEHQDTGGLFL